MFDTLATLIFGFGAGGILFGSIGYAAGYRQAKFDKGTEDQLD